MARPTSFRLNHSSRGLPARNTRNEKPRPFSNDSIGVTYDTG